MSRLRILFSESLRSLGANLSTTLAATVTVLIAMFLLGLAISLGTLLLSWSDHVKKQLIVHVYFCTEDTCDRAVTRKQENAVAAVLTQNRRVKQVDFVSKEEALAIMKKRRPDAVKELVANPFPDALKVTPRRGEDVEKVVSLLKPAPPGVERINYGKQTTHAVLRFAHILEIAFIVGVVLLVLAATLLIANTIRLSIFARRREVEVMKLVGATNWFVRGPFMLEGLLCGILGAVAAVLLLVLGKELVLQTIPQGARTADVQALEFWLTALVLLGSGLVLGAAGSGLTLRRFLKI